MTTYNISEADLVTIPKTATKTALSIKDLVEEVKQGSMTLGM